METYSNNIPKRLLDLGNGHYHINFGMRQVEVPAGMQGETRLSYLYDTVEVDFKPLKADIIESLTKEKYTIKVATIVATKLTLTTAAEVRM